MRTDLIQLNVEHNRSTESLREAFASHRDMVMQLISATVKDLTGTSDGKLSSVVLLGSGNANDIDLKQLTELFKTLHLVDLDPGAIRKSVDDASLHAEQYQLHSPIDVAEPLLSLTSRDFAVEEDKREDVLKVLQALASPNGVAEVPEADVVVSLCIFSQILESLQRIIDSRHPSFGHALKSVRLGHLRRMLNMLRPGGVAIFITDIVSSDSAPQLMSVEPADLPDLVKQLVEEQNFFSGTNPANVLADLNMLSRLPDGPDTVHTLDPWLWNVGNRVYAVYGMRIQRKLPEVELPPEATSEAE
ncbi:MAG: hypothetical protein Fues2KO_08970 [Fuerstiella sp.]